GRRHGPSRSMMLVMVTSPIFRLRMAFPFPLVGPAITLSRRAVIRVIALTAAVCPQGAALGPAAMRRGRWPCRACVRVSDGSCMDRCATLTVVAGRLAVTRVQEFAQLW